MKKTYWFLLGCGICLLFLLITCLSVSAATTYMRPNADDTRQWSTTSAFLLHWSEVDDAVSDDDVTYIYSGSPGKYDIFDFADPSFNGDIPDDKVVINYVRFYYRCRAFTSGPSTPGVSLKLYADTTHTSDFVEVASHSFGPSYATRYSDALYENPCTGTDWTVNDFDDLQVKILLDKVNANGDIARCTQIYVYIYYKCEAPVVDYEVPGNGADGVLFHVDDGVDISFNTSWWGYTPGGTRTVRCYKYISFNNASWSYIGYTQVTNNDTRVWLNESDFNEPNTTYYWRIYCYDLTFASTQYSYRSFTTKDAKIIFGQLDGMGEGRGESGGDPLYDEIPVNNSMQLFDVEGFLTSISFDYSNFNIIANEVFNESFDEYILDMDFEYPYLFASFVGSGIFVYEFTGDNLSYICNISNPDIPPSGHLFYFDNILYVGCGGNGLYALSFNGTDLSVLDNIDTGSSYGNVWAIEKNETVSTIFVLKSIQLFVYEFNGSDFVEIDDISTGAICTELYVDDNYIYVTCRQRFDIFSYSGGSLTLVDNYINNSILFFRGITIKDDAILIGTYEGFMVFHFNGTDIVRWYSEDNLGGVEHFRFIYYDPLEHYCVISEEGGNKIVLFNYSNNVTTIFNVFTCYGYQAHSLFIESPYLFIGSYGLQMFYLDGYGDDFYMSGYTFNVTLEWYNDSLGDWEQYCFESFFQNDTLTAFNSNFSGFSNLYKWRVSATANDTGVVHSEWYQFKTFVPLSNVKPSVLPEITAFTSLGGLCFIMLFWKRRRGQ